MSRRPSWSLEYLRHSVKNTLGHEDQIFSFYFRTSKGKPGLHSTRIENYGSGWVNVRPRAARYARILETLRIPYVLVGYDSRIVVTSYDDYGNVYSKVVDRDAGTELSCYLEAEGC